MKEIIRGKCLDYSSEGKVVIKNVKDIIFCDGLFLNEEADVEVLYSRAGVCYGKVRKLHTISKDRIQPKCKVCSSCGGCQFQQLRYESQLIFKTKRVKEALKRIGGIDINVPKCLGMDNPYYYRNKIQMPYGKDRKGNIIYGFFRENSHEIIPVKECVIENKKAASILWDIKELITKHRLTVYNENSNKGLLKYVLIRTSYHFDELMVVLVTTEMNFPGQRNFINELISLHPEITTIVENINPRNTNVVLGTKEKVLYGPGVIKDSILGLTFEISASSFYQVNPEQVEKLYANAIELIDKDTDKTVLDAYGGVGTIGLIASKNAAKVITVEINKSASKNAIINAKRNNVKNIECICGDASDYLYNSDVNFDVVIMDPPRKGSDKKFLNSIVKNKTEKIIYVSCNPETLARDLKYLLENNYSIKYIQPVDMFPFTSHVETIVGLYRK